MWRILRMTLLSLLLVAVASMAWLDRATTRDWEEPLWVGIFPVAADDDEDTASYLAHLDSAPFAPIEEFFATESRGYDATARPVHVEVYPRVTRLPPDLPSNAGPVRTAIWSLAMRWYAWRTASGVGRAPANIRLFVLYHSPRRLAVLPHSRGLARGLLGVVHVYAEPGMAGANNVVIAHELLHTLGATDKYDPGDLMPNWPDGYAQPGKQPLHPQQLAEIMAGRRAISAREAVMPGSLDEVVVGARTAHEIAWVPK
jgi:hypothetical protein